MILYLANAFLLWSLCVAQLNEVSQPVSLQTLNLGDSATIECYIKSLMTTKVWYKVTTGRKLQLVASFDSFFNRIVYADEFKHGYSVQSDRLDHHLFIAATSWDDVGTYFCGVMKLNDIHFGSGTFLMLKGAKMISDSVVQQPESQSVQSGDSVTLSCSVHSGQCPAEHISVMWLKNSDHSAPEMIYSPGNENNTCQMVSGETTCIYNLPMRSFSPEDAGIYHCVLTSCGQILFGNGTTITNPDTASKPLEVSPAVTALMLSNIILGIVVVILVWTLCKTRRNNSADSGSSGGDQTNDAIIYASVSSAHRNLIRRQGTEKHTGDSVVYSNIRFSESNREVSS
ncbi:uncharacterized protein LOC111562537 [Amphiprion ocellaris]|uniref:uncharacterized protein LOC111562537 n=1 Tax=Amphiprion ocellaris TaxID=80972 RepID=UPI0024119425|nr:uncharacterized protein LOC111562537 [Amphiprion ocellaris]